MIAIPAIDLREGACVQLTGGDYSREEVRLPDPLEVARHWTEAGFTWLHVIDLDAATGRGSNERTVHSLLELENAHVQVGGGLRDTDAVARMFDEGADRVIVGTRALEDEDWCDEIAHAYPGRIIVAADVRQRRVVTRGWSRSLTRDVIDVIEDLNALPLAAVLVTAVHREGGMQGTDLFLMEDVVEASEHPLMAAGGVASVADLRILEDRGVDAAVLGMALYTGALNPRETADEFQA
jgi:phosphoribosylformimino-5-aminoimidazole carboxamide ribotide isomerase